MKRFMVCFLALIFVCNSVAVAYAMPCAKTMALVQSQETQMMDCHKTGAQDEDSSAQHCKGICLCQHALLNAPALPLDIKEVSAVKISALLIHMAEPQYVSVQSPPLYRPPIA